MSYVSKKTQIKAHLLSGKSITPLQALSLYGSLRLGAVIFDLRNEDNMKIRTEMIHDGRNMYARYSLLEEK